MDYFQYLWFSQLFSMFIYIAETQETKKNCNNSISALVQENEDSFEENLKQNMKGRFRRGIADTNHRWPGYPGKGRIPYIIDSSIDFPMRINITLAMREYERHTCIRFIERTDQTEYIKLFKGEECSFEGIGRDRSRAQPQKLSLGEGCEDVGTILHELGHVIGFFHEHMRADRGRFLRIRMKNVMDGYKHNFKKIPKRKNLLLNKFNHNSIMMYSNYAFSKNERKTMVARNGKVLLPAYSKNTLDESDTERVNILYKCKLVKNFKKMSRISKKLKPSVNSI